MFGLGLIFIVVGGYFLYKSMERGLDPSRETQYLLMAYAFGGIGGYMLGLGI